MSAVPTIHLSHRVIRHDLLEACIAAALVALLYYLLQGQLPYHDAQRFTNQVGGGVFIWDIAHILLQPSAMLLHGWLGGDPAATLKALSSISSAIAVGLFYLLLTQLKLPTWQVVLGTLILATSCSVLTLAPSAHPKLVAFPFVGAAFLLLCTAERAGMRNTRQLLAGGTLLAIGAGFLASALATAPFAALGVVMAARNGGASWGFALRQAGFAVGACAIVFLVIACGGYVVLTGEPLSLAGLAGSVTGKADLRPVPIPLIVHLARAVFGTVNNLVTVPGMGATVQAWMRGQIPSMRPYANLLPVALLWCSAAMLIGGTYVASVRAVLRRQAVCMPFAFLCGAQVWTIWYGLNDPEHWFQLTAPTILLFLLAVPAAIVRRVLPVWAIAAAAVNLGLLALPVATYPLAINEVKLAAMLRPTDLLVMFVSYPGRPHVGFFNLKDVRAIAVDQRLREAGQSPESTLAQIDGEIAQTLQNGGRVLVADILTPEDWEAPWMSLLGQGVTKARLGRALLNHRSARSLDDLGGIHLWELHAARQPDRPD